MVETTGNTASITSIKFEGSLADNFEPISGVDLFLKHTRSGQLEAVRTDKSGNFDVEFHFIGGSQLWVVQLYIDPRVPVRTRQRRAVCGGFVVPLYPSG